MIPRLTKIIRSRITFVSRNVISHRLSGVSLLAVSNVNNPLGLVVLPYVMRSAHFFCHTHADGKAPGMAGPLSYHVTLDSKSLITNITVIQMPHTIYLLICHITILLTKCLVTQITAIWTLSSTYGLCYHVTLYN
jgi:hypothetical protein